MKTAKKQKIGASGILLYNGKFLLGLRKPRDVQGGRWCTPGGGVEFGESVDAALCREFQEEVGLNVLVAEGFLTTQPVITQNLHVLIVFKKVVVLNTPRPKCGPEFDLVDWLTFRQVENLWKNQRVTEATFAALKEFVISKQYERIS